MSTSGHDTRDVARRRQIVRDFKQLHFEVADLARTTAEALGLLRYTIQKVETLMADLAALNQKIAELQQQVAEDEAQDDARAARDAETVTALNAVIEDLRAQLAAANVDLQPQIDALEAIRATLHPPTP